MELLCTILVLYLLIKYGGKALSGCLGFIAGVFVFFICLWIIFFVGKLILSIILVLLAIAACASIFGD